MTKTMESAASASKGSQLKSLYILTDDGTGFCLAQCNQYSNDLACMWAARTLKTLREKHKDLIHATLWKYDGNGGIIQVQGWYRKMI